MPSIVKCAGALLSLGLLTGCSSLPVVIADRDALCNDWREITVSKYDRLTEQTASEIEGGNKSRPAWGCKSGTGESKS